MKSDEHIPHVRLPDAVLGPITKNSQIGFRRLAAKFEDECQRERTHPGVHFSMFDPLRDAGYRAYILRSDGKWLGAACFRETAYLGLVRRYTGEGDPPAWCLQWACLDRAWHNKPLVRDALAGWEAEMPNFLILDITSRTIQRIKKLVQPAAERLVEPGYEQLVWMPPAVRLAEARYWGSYRREPGSDVCLC